MATVNQHCDDCKDILGHEYRNVHIWLDYYARVFTIIPYGGYHRTFRHNSYGLKCIMDMWGKEAMESVKIHLVRDIDEFWSKDFNIWDYRNVVPETMDYFNNLEQLEPYITGPVGKRIYQDKIGVVALANKEGESLNGKEGVWR